MKYIKIFQHTLALWVSVVNVYYGYQLMNVLFGNFNQGGKYIAQIASHQAELRTEETFTDQTFLSITSLQTDYLNLDISSGSGTNNERANIVQTKCNFCGGANPSEKIKKG